MNKRTSFLILCTACLCGLVLSGCSKAIPDGNKAFQSASPELKKGWDSAMAAMTTNGYAAAILHLQALRNQPGLTAEQTKVVDQTSTSISDKMYDMANKDDPAAKQALQDLRTATGR